MKQVSIVVSDEVKNRWKKEACSLGYMNFTQFMKDAIEEKIEKGRKENK